MEVSHGVHSEVTGLVPLSDGDLGTASVLRVQVSQGDDGDRLTHPGLLLDLIGEFGACLASLESRILSHQ